MKIRNKNKERNKVYDMTYARSVITNTNLNKI